MSRYGRALLLLLVAPSPLLAQIGNIPAPTSRPPRTPPKQTGTLGGTQVREGFWIAGGLGYGATSCGPSGPRLGGLTRELEAGWTLNRRLSLGVGTTAWTKSGMGETGRLGTTVGSLDLRVRWYPSEMAGGLFVSGALGMGFIRFSDAEADPAAQTMRGKALRVGLGYDFRVARGVSVTPFANGTGVWTEHYGDTMHADIWQAGLGITVH